MSFVHLHCHSEYSLLDGANRIDDLIRRALEFEQPALAITDHGNLHAAWEFQDKARKAGLKPIVGMEAYVAPGDRRQRGRTGPDIKPYFHLVLLATNRTGYRNLVKLSSLGYTEGFYSKPRIDRELLEKYGSPTPEALVESAMHEASILEDEEFFDIKISVKHSNPAVMIEAYRQLADACDYPLHLGVTEAGPMPMGGVKSAVGIGTLLAEGIGDTIRVSLTDDPVEEVKVGNAILQSLGLRERGLDLVACPSCGRAEVNVLELTKKVEAAIHAEEFDVPIRVAVMGCVVNGPGEAREADVGIASGNGLGFVIRRGETVAKVPEDELVDALLTEARTVAAEKAADRAD